MELDLRTLLGIAWMALKGWAAQEVWDSLHPCAQAGERASPHRCPAADMLGTVRLRVVRRTSGRVAALGHRL